MVKKSYIVASNISNNNKALIEWKNTEEKFFHQRGFYYPDEAG